MFSVLSNGKTPADKREKQLRHWYSGGAEVVGALRAVIFMGPFIAKMSETSV